MKKSSKVITAFVLLIAVIFIFSGSTGERHGQNDLVKVGNKEDSNSNAFDKEMYSTSDAASLWVVVNKTRPLPGSFTPKNLTETKSDIPVLNYEQPKLRIDASRSIGSLVQAAMKDNINLALISGYRSFDEQNGIYESAVSGYGKTEADKTSARPGFSEHQTGLAVDVGAANDNCRLDTCFGDTKEGKWIAKNAHKFGFILRYKKGTKSIVGYSYEPWHLRYVGKALANEINEQGVTMEQFFGLSPAPDYK